ncbi:MAG: alcohol dehydrogenase catalytic domain-containing protein [Rubrobacter sp.]|nr:alcohol dehydrogenase catalytic domain-containing protein [Rubrobacter sp.]
MVAGDIHARDDHNLLEAPGEPLRLTNTSRPGPEARQVLIRIHACAVCRTVLHIVDGELTGPKLPLIPGHHIVGTIVETSAQPFSVGDRVGVPWLGWTCGACRYCLSSHENLCDNARFMDHHIDGGCAEYTVADHRFCFPLPPGSRTYRRRRCCVRDL